MKNFICFFVFFVFLSPSYAKAPSHTPTKRSDIIKWVDLKGGYYVLGLGKDPENPHKLIPYGVYDKQFLDFSMTSFWQKLVLGTIGINDLNLDRAIKKITPLKNKKKRHIKKIFRTTNFESPEEENTYPKDWWKDEKIKWIEGKKPDINKDSPEKIPLWTIDLQDNSKLLNLLEKIIKNFMQSLDEDLKEGFQKDHSFVKKIILSGVFLKQQDGTYKLVNETPDTAPPVKVIDLKGKHSSYKQAVSWASMTNIAKLLVSYVPAPGAAQLLVVLMERMFNMVEVLYLIHHAAALNLVLDALDGDKKSPFYDTLSQEELLDSAMYIRRSNTLISGLIKNGMAGKDTLASKYHDKAKVKSAKTLRYLKKKGFELHGLSSQYYVLGAKRSEKGELKSLKVYSLIKTKVFRKKPADIIDFLNPQQAIISRNIIEASLVATNCIYIPVPLVQTALKVFYKELFVREIHRRQMQEGGFSSYMDHHKKEVVTCLMEVGYGEIEAEKMVKKAYKYLNKRTLNTLELNQHERTAHRKRVNNWLRIQDPSFVAYLEEKLED